MTKKTETKEQILRAAAEIINVEGVFSLTLEAVAKKAGISKGGLLYHFPTKDDLFNQAEEDIDMNTAFLAAVATNPELLKQMAKSLQEVHTNIENDNINPIIATIVRLAVDGMYFNQLYGMNLQEDTRKKVLNYLISLTKEEK
ncbi:hypothetical protein SRRS_32680 [Sporomusa rhizae]|uniref:TetR/AcrR family transcriptional regulator n=1 Tax=Sporomusa rhizae TaxID=357999 RepID=UPI00352BBDA7